MSDWRTTTENPPTDGVDGLDHERCAAIHNLIVERGWVQRGFDLDILDKRTWWECFGGDAELLPQTTRLDTSVVAFLKAAWHGYAMGTSQRPHAFHRYLASLSPPGELWSNVNYADDEDDSNKERYITLYMANWALGASHPLGLVYDQYDCTAVQHMSIIDSFTTLNGRQAWLPLELVLDSYLDMMDQGKVVATNHNDSYDGEQERIEPWIMPSYTDTDLEETVEAFDALVEAIESKLPTATDNIPGDNVGNSNSPDTAAVCPDGFATRLLTRIRRPRFQYIAPGLKLAQQQPFACVPIEDGKLRPFLLFESSVPAHKDTYQSPYGQPVLISPFHQDFRDVTDYPAGVYLTESDPNDMHPYEDGCKLILPYVVGGNGFARKSDGSLFGEDTHANHGQPGVPEPRAGEIYQLGYNHFTEGHDVQLKYVLWRWVEMVEEGKWQVDSEGVEGGIEKWQEVDTEERWEDYQLPMSW